MKPSSTLSAGLPACLPPIRPTRSGRIEPVFYNTEYQHANTDLLCWLRFIHWAMVSPFILHYFSFSLTDEWMKRREVTEEVLMNYTAYTSCYTYYVTLMAKCMCTWLHHSLKLLPSIIFLLCTNSSQPGWFMLRLLCAFLGHDLPIQLLLKLLSSTYNGDRLIDHFHHVPVHITNYKYVTLCVWTNRQTRFIPMIYQYSCFFM